MNNSLFDAEEDKENVNNSLKAGLNSGREPFAVKTNEVCGFVYFIDSFCFLLLFAENFLCKYVGYILLHMSYNSLDICVYVYTFIHNIWQDTRFFHHELEKIPIFACEFCLYCFRQNRIRSKT